MNTKFLTILGVLMLNACGGGGGSDGKVFEGLLTQGEGISHSQRLGSLKQEYSKHGEDQAIEEVKVCALGRCSSTDSNGTFGFSGPSEFKGGDILFTFEGHGIVAEKVINIPEAANSVFIHFETNGSDKVSLHHMDVNGARVDTSENHSEESHSEGSHSHD